MVLHAEEEYKKPMHTNTYAVRTFKSPKCGKLCMVIMTVALKHVFTTEALNDACTTMLLPITLRYT
jgi:hypothetical protein